MRTRYVLRNGELVEKDKATPLHNQQNYAQSDIKEFRAPDGTFITSRSALRAYEQKNGVRQVGTDWIGPPALRDMHLARLQGWKDR